MSYTIISEENLRYKFPEFSHKDTWIAGGAIRSSILNKKPNDIDVFGKSEEAVDNFIEENLSNGKKVYDSGMIRTYKIQRDEEWKVQVMSRFYDSIQDCLDSFDFTICQFAKNNDLTFANPDGIIHTFRKKLVINNIQEDFAVDTLRRIQKYVKKGFEICDGGLLQIANSIREMDEESFEQNSEYYPGREGELGPRRIIPFD